MNKFLIPLSDYSRIHRVGYGVIEQMSNVEKSCIFFSIYGAYILNKIYNIEARAVAGLFSLCVDDEPKVASFGRFENDLIVSDEDGFHMWVQTKTHIIDFMAPVFPESFAPQLEGDVLPRKMFQRLLTSEAEKPEGLKKAGDFISYPNLELSHKLIERFFDRNDTGDLVHVAEAWFGKRRGKTPKQFAMQNDLGKVYNLNLPTTLISGSW